MDLVHSTYHIRPIIDLYFLWPGYRENHTVQVILADKVVYRYVPPGYVLRRV